MKEKMKRSMNFSKVNFITLAACLPLALAETSSAAPSIIVVNSSSQCSKLAPEISGPCLSHAGSKDPFAYYEIRNETDCQIFKDTTILDQCMQKMIANGVFQISTGDATSNGHFPEAQNGHPPKSIKSPIEQIASSTKTLVIFGAINLGITLTAIAVSAFIYFISD